MSFQPAEKTQARLRLCLIGPAGSGKTYTSLTLAQHLGDKVAVIDTEHGSAAKYADVFQFDTVGLQDFSPDGYIALLKEAADVGYDVLVIDSLTHEWKWCLEEVDNVMARTKNFNSYAAWREITPKHNALTEAILASPCHVIATTRSKMEYVLEENEKGKKVPRKVGMAPVQRDGLEFEFDVIGDMDIDNTLVVSKTRCSALAGKVIRKPGVELADSLKAWLGGGVPPTGARPPAVVSSPVPEKTTQAKAGGEAPSPLVAELVAAFGGKLDADQQKAVDKHLTDDVWLQRALDKVKEKAAKAEEPSPFRVPDAVQEKLKEAS